MITPHRILITILLVCIVKFSISQTTILLFLEDFNSPTNSFLLNKGAVGNNIGNNKWIINDEYDGQGVKPNTTSQNITYSGTITSAPYSTYAHIHDSALATPLNNNYNNTVVSDRFLEMSDGLCTQGMTNVKIEFFYLCEGTSTAYGEVYYHTGSGSWTKVGAAKYKDKNKWKFEQISDPAFEGVQNLRFGFRWVNDAAGGSDSIAFGLDDIKVVADYDSITSPVTIDILSVDSIVCPGDNLILSFALSDTLCDGSYHIEMSDASGSFNPPFASWVYNMNYPMTSAVLALTIPFSTPPGICYLFRVNRISPAPFITGTVSACVEVDVCPNVISTTDPPAVTLDSNAVCIYSVIDVPFWSTGVYNPNNIYTAQLSDSSGSFSSPSTLGTLNDNTTYDPALVPAPGMVSGVIPVVPPGCNYYVRVVSSSPYSIGSEWGPFCIQECDIGSNGCANISVCPGDSGLTFSIPVSINTWDSLTTYYPGNTFSVEVLDKMTFSTINNGVLGAVLDTVTSTINLHIPPCDSLVAIGIQTMGFPGGSFYLRIIADSANDMEQTLGCVVNLSVGCPNQVPYDIIPAFPWSTYDDTILCVGDPIFVMVSPYNPSSEFMYFVNGNPIAPNNPPVMLGIYWTSAGMSAIEIQETHIGCSGPISNPFDVYVIEAPQMLIIGPDTSCIYDTLDYWAQFFEATHYNWNTSLGGTLIDTGNNEISILWDSLGTFNIQVDATNKCGFSSSSMTVSVVDERFVNILGDTVGCEGSPFDLFDTNAIGTFLWSIYNDTIWSFAGASLLYSDIFILGSDIVSVELNTPHCGIFYDTVSLDIIPLSTFDLGIDDTIYSGESVVLSVTGGGTYLWHPTGETTSSITVSPTETTVYTIVVEPDSCIDSKTIYVELPEEMFVPNLFFPNGDNPDDQFLKIFGGGLEELDFRIYDRWGELIKHYSGKGASEVSQLEIIYPNNGWDGKFKGVDLNSAVFVYTLKATFMDGREIEQHGNITLIR